MIIVVEGRQISVGAVGLHSPSRLHGERSTLCVNSMYLQFRTRKVRAIIFLKVSESGF